MADLTYLNEASVIHNLRLRYHSNLIYVSLLFSYAYPAGLEKFTKKAFTFDTARALTTVCMRKTLFHRHTLDCSWSQSILTVNSASTQMRSYSHTSTRRDTRQHRTSLQFPTQRTMTCCKTAITSPFSSRKCLLQLRTAADMATVARYHPSSVIKRAKFLMLPNYKR